MVTANQITVIKIVNTDRVKKAHCSTLAHTPSCIIILITPEKYKITDAIATANKSALFAKYEIYSNEIGLKTK